MNVECIEETGVIKEAAGGMISVSLSPSSRCRACGVCSSGHEKEMRLTVPNSGNFSVGDKVKISIEGRNLLLASFVVYIVPLLDMFIGYFFGWYLMNKYGDPAKAGLAGALAGGLFFVLSFFLSRLVNQKMERQERRFINVERV